MPTNKYSHVDRRPYALTRRPERSAADYAHLQLPRRQMLTPPSVVGPALGAVLLAVSGAIVAYAAYLAGLF